MLLDVVPVEIIKVTEYVPFLLYMWLGFCTLDVVPSPNNQLYVFIFDPVDVLVKLTVDLFFAEVGDAVNDKLNGAGGTATVI